MTIKQYAFFVGTFLLALIGKSQSIFGDKNIITGEEIGLEYPRGVHAGDIDGDGDMDAVAVSSIDNKIGWFENTDGFGTFSTLQLISDQAADAEAVFLADLDGDGDLDILFAAEEDQQIAWYKNLDGAGHFGALQTISAGTDWVVSVSATDLDGDGDLDVLASSFEEDKIIWFRNLNGTGNFGSQLVITSEAKNTKFSRTADFDQDGDMDIVASASEVILFFKNGGGSFGTPDTIAANLDGADEVHPADIDGDGDLDVVFSARGDWLVGWIENEDGNGNFGVVHTITGTAQAVSSCFPADLDGDGDMDVIASTSTGTKVGWYENLDGLGNFGSENIINTAVRGESVIYATDLDGDNDMDIISASNQDRKVAWYRNEDGLGNFGIQQFMAVQAISIRGMYAADLDNDGDLDVLSASSSDNKIAWYENLGFGHFGQQIIISTQVDEANDIYVSDLDNDGDMDIISAASSSGEIAWYENLDGTGTFSNPHIISTQVIRLQGVLASDVDGDGDMDVLSASSIDDKVAWYENLDGLGTFGNQRVITTNAEEAKKVYTADLDSDGDLDVLSASSADDKIAWYENLDGLGTFGNEQILTTEADAAQYVFAADLDNDDDLDVLFASSRDGKIAWLENETGTGDFGNENLIDIQDDGATFVRCADFDLDNDLDVLSISWAGDKVFWYENVDGMGQFSTEKVISTSQDGPMAAFPFDIDGDGDLDVLAGSLIDSEVAWYENLLKNTVIISLNESICPGSSIEFGGQTYEQPGVYKDTIFTSSSLDSIVILNLSIAPTYDENFEINICNNEGFVFGDTTYMDAGMYQYTFETIHGCDSTVTVTLGILPTFDESIAEEICANQSFVFGDMSYTETGVYQHIFEAMNGCDSIVELTLTVFEELMLDNVTIIPDNDNNSDGSIQLSFVNAVEPLTFAWSNGATTPNVSQLTEGIYELMVTDANDCQFFFEFEVPLVLSANTTSTLVNTTIFPNPFHHSTRFTLGQLPHSEKAILRLWNSHGQFVQEYIINSNSSIEIGQNGLMNGLYLFELTTQSSGVLLRRGKLIKQ